MDFQKVKSYKDFEVLLKESSTEDIRANFKTIETLISVLNDKWSQTIDKWNVDLNDKRFFEGSIEQRFSEFKSLLPTFKEELDSMVECAKIIWNKDVLESLSDEKITEMMDCHIKMRKYGLQHLDAIYNVYRTLVNPHEVIAEYKELEKQNPRPTPSNSGCMVVVLLFIISIATILL